jgi:hypothetical protein
MRKVILESTNALTPCWNADGAFVGEHENSLQNALALGGRYFHTDAETVVDLTQPTTLTWPGYETVEPVYCYPAKDSPAWEVQRHRRQEPPHLDRPRRSVLTDVLVILLALLALAVIIRIVAQ